VKEKEQSSNKTRS